MPIDRISQELLVVTFSDRRRLNDELKAVNNMVRKGSDCHVFINLRGVEMMNSTNLCNLIILRRSLNRMGRKLILYNASLPIKCLFTVTGLRGIFKFTEDRDEAIEALAETDYKVSLPR